VRAVAVALEAWHPRHPRDIARGGEFFTRARLFRRRPRSTRARAGCKHVYISRVKSSMRCTDRRSPVARPANVAHAPTIDRSRAIEGNVTASSSSSSPDGGFRRRRRRRDDDDDATTTTQNTPITTTTTTYLLDVFERRRGDLGDGRLGDGRLGDNLDAGERARDRGHDGRSFNSRVTMNAVDAPRGVRAWS